MIALDTCALIDLQRETKRKQSGPVIDLIRLHANEPIFVPVVAAIEFGEGFPPGGQTDCDQYLAPFVILNLENAMIWHAAQVRRQLRQAGTSIGDNDLLIGVTALHYGLELITKNQRIPSLKVVTY